MIVPVNTNTALGNRTRPFIARHNSSVYMRGLCDRYAYLFDAPFAPASVKCPDCGRKMTHIELVKGQTDQTRKCSWQCKNATKGGICACSCGGMNHGIAWKTGKALTAGKASSRHSLGR